MSTYAAWAVFITLIAMLLAPLAVAKSDQASPLPPTLVLPASRVGDRGVYTETLVQMNGGAVEIASPEKTVTGFERLPDRFVLDAARDARPAIVYFEQVSSESGNSTFLRETEPTNGTVLAFAHVDFEAANDHTFFNRTFLEFVPNDGSRGLTTAAPLCGLTSPLLQGHTIDLTRDIVLFPASCRMPVGEVIPAIVGVPFHAEEVINASNSVAIVFRSTHGLASVWYSPDYPYPLRIAYHAHPNDPYHVLRLSRFQAPSGSAPPEPSPATSPSPLAFAKREMWGPASGGADVAYPLSDAFASARDNPDDATLKSFIAEHPQAYVSLAEYGETTVGSKQDFQWQFVLTDGHDAIRTMVTKHLTTQPSSFGPAVPQIPGATGTTSASPSNPEITYHRETLVPEQAVPPQDIIPQDLPTLHSIFETWRAYAAPEFRASPINAWRMSISLEKCENQGANCDKAVVRLTAGSDVVTHENGMPTRATSLLTLNEKGEAVTLDEMRVTPIQPTPPAIIPWSPQEMASLGANVDVGLQGLLMPVGAAIAFLAILGLWLRGGGLAALYSRVVGSPGDHKTRRRILDLIERQPGLHLAAISKELCLPDGTTRYHLRRLRKLVNIKRTRVNGCDAYWIDAGTEPSFKIAILRSKGARKVLHAARDLPGASGKSLAHHTGLDPATVAYHLIKLGRSGLLDAHKSGRELHVTLTPQGRRALDQITG